MKVEKKSKSNLDYKRIAIIIGIIALIIILIIVIKNSSKTSNDLELDDFEKIAVYSYLEDNLLDVSTLYSLSGNSDYNDIQIFQAKLKQALDEYFSTSSDNEVSTSTILGLIDSQYIPSNVDFHGILVSDYEYDTENDTFVKSAGANANISGLEAEINTIDYSDKKADVQKIEKLSDNTFKVTFNIVNSTVEDGIAEATGEVVLSIQDDELVIDSCTINE